MAQSKIAVVTVHGTGDTADSDTGEKWFQKGSKFTEQLKQKLAAKGVQADIVPHRWSGANSAWAREQGANKLAGLIRRLYDRYDGIHVIGHSHGGNVANDAAVLLKWGLRRHEKYERFDSLTTVGTPFFNIRTGWPQLVAGVLFLIIAWASAIAFPLVAGALLYEAVTGNSLTDTAATDRIAALVYIGIVGPCVLFMLNMSRQGIRRILRPKSGGKTKTSVFSIWHENDEAIAFLQRVEELPLEPFPRGSLFRGSRGVAVSIGVLAVLAVGLANPLLYAMGMADFLNIAAVADEDIAGNIFAATLMSLLVAPMIFVLVYLGYRFVIGGAQEIGVRGTMNRFVVGVLRGVAMGRDGDQVLCKVGPRSHTHRTEEHVLSGACAARMQENANGAAGKLIDKYRWAMFSVGGDSSGSLTSLTTDAMTWDSLIHTTYFDQPEVADLISAYIVAKATRAEFAAPAPAPVAPPPAGAPQPEPPPAGAPQPEPPPAGAPQPA